MTATIPQMEAALKASGKMALAAKSVIDANSLNLSVRIEQLQIALSVYDNLIRGIRIKPSP